MTFWGAKVLLCFRLLLPMLIALTACAKRPDAIAPIAVNDTGYMAMDCQQLTNELNLERKKLASLTKQQNDAATGDAVGVFLIGVPTASVFGGDQEGNLAVSKGTVLAMENAERAKNCGAISAQPNVVQVPATAAAATPSPTAVNAAPVPQKNPAKLN
jgi:hypothetical protein